MVIPNVLCECSRKAIHTGAACGVNKFNGMMASLKRKARADPLRSGSLSQRRRRFGQVIASAPDHSLGRTQLVGQLLADDQLQQRLDEAAFNKEHAPGGVNRSLLQPQDGGTFAGIGQDEARQQQPRRQQQEEYREFLQRQQHQQAAASSAAVMALPATPAEDPWHRPAPTQNP